MYEATLLIIEVPGHDSMHVRQLAVGAGYRVVACNCSHMASMATISLGPDVVLIAPQPSVERASEIARAIKEDPATTDIPVLLLTDSNQPEDFLARAYPTEACLSVTCTDDEWRSTMRLLTSHVSQRSRGPRPGALEGDLDDDVFPELFQYLCLTGKRGRVKITSGGIRGRIDLANGVIVHAELDRWDGVDAFERICLLSRGRFEFESDDTNLTGTMREKGIDLLLRAVYKKDELTRKTPTAVRRTSTASEPCVSSEKTGRPPPCPEPRTPSVPTRTRRALRYMLA